ncbi:hypothetical protein ILUMI_20705 [Ignelater luminosus]|uniref:Uncharacterized protein n=1 Tax=Ignelater luminosus TaxID=2038154 RepID=A0A8K0G232_IGNLU|nr:hypothetical protein ILUMI_20705 [Ignelater luminosus]
MKKAAGNESTSAIEEGNVDAVGIPCITVIVDGFWRKRSYNMNSTFMVAMQENVSTTAVENRTSLAVQQQLSPIMWDTINMYYYNRRKRIERRNPRQELRKKEKLTLTSKRHNIYYGLNAATGVTAIKLAEANSEKIKKATQLQKESGLLKEGNGLLLLNLEEYANYEIRHLEMQQHSENQNGHGIKFVGALFAVLKVLAKVGMFLVGGVALLVIGGIFTTAVCSWTQLCTITFSGFGKLNKDTVRELVTPERVANAAAFVEDAVQKYQRLQRAIDG